MPQLSCFGARSKVLREFYPQANGPLASRRDETGWRERFERRAVGPRCTIAPECQPSRGRTALGRSTKCTKGTAHFVDAKVLRANWMGLGNSGTWRGQIRGDHVVLATGPSVHSDSPPTGKAKE